MARSTIPVLVAAIILVAGCKKGEPSPSQPTNTESPRLEGSNKPAEPTPNITDQPGAKTSVPSTKISGNSATNSTPRTTTGAGSAVPATPKENPNAAPPKPGEQVASDFKIQTPNQTIEIEGVCKLTEDEAVCWKPDGDSNPDLARELTSAIEAQTNSYSNGFQFKFKKKNRVLVLKTTTPPRRQGESGGSYNSGVMQQYGGGSDFMESWTNNYSIFSGSSSTGFDQTRVERSVMTGAFNAATKTFPLRYQITKYEQSPSSSIVAKKGTIEVGGNTYEIVSVSDKSPTPGYQPPSYGPNAGKAKYSFLAINPVKINDPYAIVTLTPADESGSPYGGLDSNGNPISAAQAAKKREEDQKKLMEASRSGKPFMGMSNSANFYLQPITLDPSYAGSKQVLIVNVELSKLKKFAVNVQHRSVYVFDKVKLDPN